MTTVYEIRSASFSPMYLIGNEDIDNPFPSEKMGTPMAADWVPRSYFIKREKRDAKRVEEPVLDATHVGLGKLFLLRHAAEKLEPVIGHLSEYLPLKVPGYDSIFVNPLNVLDVINYDKCEFKRNKDGFPLRILRYVLNTPPNGFPALFILRGKGAKLLCCTEQFKQAVEDLALTGFAFERLWSSDEEGN